MQSLQKESGFLDCTLGEIPGRGLCIRMMRIYDDEL